MAYIADTHLSKSIQFGGLLEFGRDYCSDQLGRFFQNNYSLPGLTENKFVIPTKLARRSEQEGFAICVMMNNHIVDLKYIDDLIHEGESNLNIINCINDPRLLTIIKRFMKINDEILIGRCKGFELIAL